MQVGSVQQSSVLATYPASLGAAGMLDSTHSTASGSQNSALSYRNPMDADGDGVVSAMERLDYALTHPGESSEESANAYYKPEDADRDGVVSPMERILYALENPTASETGYTERGTLSAAEASSSNVVDVYA